MDPNASEKSVQHVPWNRGKLIGRLRVAGSCLQAAVAATSPYGSTPGWFRTGGPHWLGSLLFGTHSLRRTKATLNLPAHRKPSGGSVVARPHVIESTVRYLGIEVDDALAIAEQVDV